MLIIFDLDDTLIDTSGSITPFKMRECLKRLVAEGFPISDFEKAHAELLSINGKSAKSKDALQQFIAGVKNGAQLIEKAMEEMIKPLPADFVVSRTPHAKEILESLKKTHALALVTGGYPPFQLEKLEKAGIDRAIFSKIAIPEDSVKKPFYQKVAEEFSVSPNQVLVCGDRIAMDLVPAFELGFTTVHMRWGRGNLIETEKWVHHAISDLSELKRIVEI